MMKYLIIARDDEGLGMAQDFDNWEKAKDRFELLKDLNVSERGQTMLITTQKWESIELYKLEPISTSQLHIGEELR